MTRQRLFYPLVAALVGPPCYFLINMLPEGNMNLQPTTVAEHRVLDPFRPIEAAIEDITDPVALLVIERLQDELADAREEFESARDAWQDDRDLVEAILRQVVEDPNATIDQLLGACKKALEEVL